MVKLKLKCVGKSPLLMEKFEPKKLPKGASDAEVASSKIYRRNGHWGKIGIPCEMLLSCLMSAGRSVKNGKKKISTAKTTTLLGFMSIQEMFIPFTNLGSWKIDVRSGAIDKKAIRIVRPRFDEWEFTVTIEYNEKMVDESTLRTLFETAGSTCGLGIFRPSHRGSFGRFAVESWTTKDVKAA